MQKLTILATTALIALAGPALAGNPGKTGSKLNYGISAGAQGSAGMHAGQPNFGTIVSTIRASKSEINEIRNLAEVESVEIVDVSELGGGAQAEARAVENAVSENQLDIEELRTAIEANQELNAELASQGVALDTVVAAKVETGGKVMIFTRRG